MPGARMPPGIDSHMEAFRDFDQAAKAILDQLHRTHPLTLWMITRDQSDYWVVLHAVDRGYRVRRGDILLWPRWFCDRLSEGDGPNTGRDIGNIPVYRDTPARREMAIGRFLSYPLRRDDESLLGTLCGFDPEPGDGPSAETNAEAVFLARVLATLLANELDADAVTDAFAQIRHQAEEDFLTGVHNRRGWEEALETAEGLCGKLGSSASVLYVDLDDLKETNDRFGHEAGDRLIIRAARALEAAIRESDYLARLGGDEFGILALGCNVARARQISKRVVESLGNAGVRASVGCSTRDPDGNLWEALERADRQMYEHKRAARG